MEERAGREDSSNGKSEHLEIQTLRERDDGQRCMEEGVKVQESILYSDNRMVASTNPGWIHTSFDTLMGLFDWVGLKDNFRKTMGMVCHPFREAGVWEDEDYTRRMTGVGRRYK